MKKDKITGHNISNMAGLTNMPLSGRNAIGQWFGQKTIHSAFELS